MTPRPASLLFGLVLVVAACSTPGAPVGSATDPGGGSSPPSNTPSANAAATTSAGETVRADPLARPAIDGAFEVGGGRKMYVQCWGEGSPTIVIEAGEISQSRHDAALFMSRLADQRRVCAYDRAGLGQSDPAPDRPRQLEDLTGDLHALLETAGVDGPLVLVGPSFGGMIVAFYANRYPEDVNSVVLLDVPAPSATMTEEDEPELAWDHPGNVEHNDVVAGFENRLANERFPFEAPLLVITGSDGHSSVGDQAFWLDWSPSSEQTEVQAGHEVYLDQPLAVADAILAMGE